MRNLGLGPSPSPGVRDMGARGLTPLGQRFCVRRNRFERSRRRRRRRRRRRGRRRRRRRQASPSRGRVPPTPATHYIVRNTSAMRAQLMGSHRSFIGPINLRSELDTNTRAEIHNVARISTEYALTPTREGSGGPTTREGASN